MITDIRKISVLYHADVVGTLQIDPSSGVCVFEYDKSWLANGFSISPLELPLQSGLFYADKNLFGGNFAAFENSLPDGYGLYLIDRMLKKKNSSLKELTPLQRLSIVGTAGMGALSYVPMMPGISAQKELNDSERLDYLQDEALKVLSEKEIGDETLLYYNSANSGGTRPKVTMKTQDGSRWIVKFRHVYDSPEIGREELLYMTTARKCGIDIPRIGLLRDRYFAIERFDITKTGERLHVLTAAALLKKDFRRQDMDYTNLLALTGYLTQDPAQVEEMYRRMVMNIVAINKDDHANNFSFICNKGKWSLAPAYDITYSPQGTHGEHATSVFYDGNPNLSLVVRAGTEIHIPKESCIKIIEKVESVCAENLKKVNKLTETTKKRREP
ncbi:MAG: type II toxin-antitoxin system HipA family toxin [Bacteroidales bacterium]|nr:type II toxin-antitoxin system HipA family toxin [Bacteroidales bacterium]